MNNNKQTNGNGTNGSNKNGNKPKNTSNRRKQRVVQNGNMLSRVSGNIPLSYAQANIRPVNNKRCRHAGSDFLSTVTVKADISTPGNRILSVIPISPSAFPGTRLTQFSQLYEFYKFSKFHLRYVPAVPVTLACQLVLYVDLDPLDDASTITNADALIRQAVAQTGAQQWNFHTPKVIPMAMRTDQQFYYTGDDRLNERFTLQGKAYLVQVTNAVDVSGNNITSDIIAGSLFIDWVCDFNVPQINPEASILSAAEPTLNYTRDSGWDAEQVWNMPFDGILLPNTYYTAALSCQYTALPPTTTGSSIILRYGSSIIAIAETNSTGSYRVSGGPFAFQTDSKGKPQSQMSITVTNSVASVLISGGVVLRPLRTGGAFATTASTIVV